MVQSPPDLASFNGTGPSLQKMEEAGACGDSLDKLIQRETVSSPSTVTRPIPRNFVWRLHGGRRSSSTSPTESTSEQGDMAVAVEVPTLRDSFDPWGAHEKEEEDGRCKGCSKILKARAAAAAVVVPTPHGE